MRREELISIAGLVISIIALSTSFYFAQQQDVITKKINYQFIMPEVSCIFNNPQNNSPSLIVKNRSPIKIVSMGIVYGIYDFDKALRGIKGSSQVFGDLFGDPIYRDELMPSENIVINLDKIGFSKNDPNYIITFLFDISYYRDTDLQKFNDRELFFLDNGKVFTQKEFLKNDYYNEIMKEINTRQVEGIGNTAPIENLSLIISMLNSSGQYTSL